MLAIALVFGTILVVCSHFLAVRKDERIEQVEKLLANSNCGGCGKAGCAQFAEALVKGEVRLSDCRATPAANKEQIAKILGGGEIGEETVAVVHCNGGNACYDKYDYQGYGNCASCELIAGGVKACPVGCIGKKTCADVCPHHAISVEDGGYAVVDKGKCISCGVCIPIAPSTSSAASRRMRRYISPVPITARAKTLWNCASAAASAAASARKTAPPAPLRCRTGCRKSIIPSASAA